MLLIFLLEGFSLVLDVDAYAASTAGTLVMRHSADASFRIIAVIKLVRVDEVPLVSILVVRFNKLVRELAHQRLIIG